MKKDYQFYSTVTKEIQDLVKGLLRYIYKHMLFHIMLQIFLKFIITYLTTHMLSPVEMHVRGLAFKRKSPKLPILYLLSLSSCEARTFQQLILSSNKTNDNDNHVEFNVRLITYKYSSCIILQILSCFLLWSSSLHYLSSLCVPYLHSTENLLLSSATLSDSFSPT